MSVHAAVIYYSATGNVYALARAVITGAEKAGAETRLRKVRELAPEEAVASNEGWQSHTLETQDIEEASLADLEWADAVLFGTPTRFGNVAAQVKQFMDTTGPLWAAGKLANKVYGGFVSTATAHGGQESNSPGHEQHLLSLGWHHRRAWISRSDPVRCGQPVRGKPHLRQRRQPARRDRACGRRVHRSTLC